MVFPFSFRFPLPGITNPFASSSSVTSGPAFIPPTNTEPNIASSSRLSHTDTDKTLPNHTRYRRVSRANLPKINRPRPSPSPSPSPGPTGPTNSRKRGWEPTFASPSQSSTTLLSTSGYLDTPAKYREMAAAQAAGIGYEDITMSDEIARAEQEMPPNKKRRGLAGSIVSTALSAALIGTAVGLTVYRLWRDRGKEPEPMTLLPPPPPYQQGEWRPTDQPEPVRVNKSRSRSPSVHESRVPSSPQPPQPHMTPRSAKRVKQVTTQQKRTATYQRRAVRARGHGHAHVPTPSTASAGFSPRPEFDFASGAQEESGGVIEDQMDWIGDKLAMLIEQGKRALNSEVVVMSDAKEDEVDDGTGDWVEDEDESEYSRRGRYGSPASSIRSGKRGRRPQSIVPPSPPSSSTPSHLYGSALGSAPLDYTTSPYQHHHQYSSASSSYPTHSRGMSHDSTLVGLGFNTPSRPARSLYASGSIASASSVSLATVQPEEPSAWESPEIRESMERARARFAMRRGG